MIATCGLASTGTGTSDMVPGRNMVQRIAEKYTTATDAPNTGVASRKLRSVRLPSAIWIAVTPIAVASPPAMTMPTGRLTGMQPSMADSPT